MKKVLAIAPYPFLPFYSGGQKFIARFFEHLAQQTELTVISTASNDWSLAQGYKGLGMLKEKFSRYIDPTLISKVTNEIRSGGYDTVIWEHPYYAWLASRIKKLTGVTTVLHTHNIEFQRFRSTGKWWWPVLRSYEKTAFRIADRILFITREDMDFAIRKLGVAQEKCIDIPFGIDNESYPDDKSYHSQVIRQRHQIAANERILFFNGLLDYTPNLDAVKSIIDNIEPVLKKIGGIPYKIILCGKGLPPGIINSLRDHPTIVYAGFVPDIRSYFIAADLFINPVTAGGGIKTKIVEAIGFGNTVVSTETGATGIVKEVCGGKLVTAGDSDYESFAKAVIENAPLTLRTPPEYYKYYNWKKIIGNLVNKLADELPRKSKIN